VIARAGGLFLALAAGVSAASASSEALARRASWGSIGIPLAMMLLGLSMATNPPDGRASKVFGWLSFAVAAVWVVWGMTGQG
jgi:hypothetical protein